jgi:hypothetical protein
MAANFKSVLLEKTPKEIMKRGGILSRLAQLEDAYGLRYFLLLAANPVTPSTANV